jgi:SAM-dependent methyltransferase
MAKSGEINYLNAIGEDGRLHARNKPFSDPMCGQYLTQLGQIMYLLPPPPCRILDLGCGTGWTTTLLARRGYQMVGGDLAQDMIESARDVASEQGVELEFVCADYESMDFADEFDGALFFDALHHAEDEYAALQSVYRALKPNGICVVSEPGTGHSTAPASRHAVEHFDVNEKDMPPRRVAALAKQIGFSKKKLYPHPTQVMRLFYPVPTGTIPVRMKWLEARIVNIIKGILLAGFFKWRNGLVVLTK